MKKIVFNLVLVVVVLVMTSCTNDARGKELESKQQVVIPTPIEVVLASEKEVEQPEVEEEKTEQKQLVDVEVILGPYNDLWDFKEYGVVKTDYFHPEFHLKKPEAQFKFSLEGWDYHCGLYLKPPSYRALMSVYSELGIPKDEDYQVEIIHDKNGECEYLTINSVVDSFGQKVWDVDMKRDPRPLNSNETWAVKWAHIIGEDFLIESWFDYQPVCDNNNNLFAGCNRLFSPADEFARIYAFVLKVSDPSQNVWVQDRIVYESNYRWIDYKTGTILQRTDVVADLWEVPSSGELALQIEKDGFWETTSIVKVGSGWVVSLNEQGELVEVVPVEFSQLSDYEIILRTRIWSYEEMLFYLLQLSDSIRNLPDQGINA